MLIWLAWSWGTQPRRWRLHLNMQMIFVSSANETMQPGPIFLCLRPLFRLCGLWLFLSLRILCRFPLFFCMDKSYALSDSNIHPANARAPPLDPAGPSGNLKQVMRTSPLLWKTAVRCPGCCRSDQCSLIFLCGTWMCFLRGWGSADPSTARLSWPNKRGLDTAALLVRVSVCRFKSCNSR